MNNIQFPNNFFSFKYCFVFFQVTCRNRKVGKTYSCHLCTKKGFLSKLRLAEHEKRKHPTVVVTSVVHGGNVSLTSPPTTSPSQSDILKMRETQTSTNQTIPPMTCRPPSNTSSSESSILQATSYSNANMSSPIIPNLTFMPVQGWSPVRHCQTLAPSGRSLDSL